MDFFPLVKQMLADAYRLDSMLLQAPYTELERLDLGLRKMVWGTYSTNTPIFSISENSPYQIMVLESSLGFYNIIASISTDEHPDFIGIMPFRSEPISKAAINKIMKENSISSEHSTTMYRFYFSLPVVPLNEMLITLRHLISFFIPEFADASVEYLSYRSEKHMSIPSEERFDKFNSDYIMELHQRMNACCNSIISGNPTLALEKMKHLTDFYTSSNPTPLPQMRHELNSLNTFLSSRMFETAVHPYYVYRQSQSFENKISEAASLSELSHLPFEMARKYAILAQNYTYEKYSYLIRNVVNYIDQHISEELSLSLLAQEYGKNPSYLSNAFKREVGDTITNYIAKQRISASLRYFNTTNMSVAEVAETVGIADFGYFSKLFKKHIGVSPREYKHILDK